MCNIFWLQPGVMPKQEEFYNCVWNNWHGFGLILKENNKLQVYKEVPEENDPKQLWELLWDNRDVERYLHVRHATSGGVDKENAHPFPIISSKKGDVWFMHNGTLNEFNPKVMAAIKAGDPREKWSDSRFFAEEILTPFMGELKSGADIHSGIFKRTIARFWPQHDNRGILISSTQNPLILGSWCTRHSEDGKEYASANNTYFDAVTRGPEYDRRKKIAEEERRKKAEAVNSNITPFEGGSSSKNRKLKNDHFTKVYGVTQEFRSIVDDPELYENENLMFLCNITAVEMELLMQKLGDDVVYFILYLTNALRDHVQENETLTRKNDSATKMIATMKTELQGLRRKVAQLQVNGGELDVSSYIENQFPASAGNETVSDGVDKHILDAEIIEAQVG